MKRNIILVPLFLALLALAGAAFVVFLFPAYGTISRLLFPPKDLYAPLASMPIKKEVRKYEFIVQHKYPGAHEVRISIPRQNGMESLLNDLTVTLDIEQEGKSLMKRSGSGEAFWGIKRQGAGFCRYNFPTDLSSRGNVICKVAIAGDIDSLLDRYRDLIVEIIKGSDE